MHIHRYSRGGSVNDRTNQVLMPVMGVRGGGGGAGGVDRPSFTWDGKPPKPKHLCTRPNLT